MDSKQLFAAPRITGFVDNGPPGQASINMAQSKYELAARVCIYVLHVRMLEMWELLLLLHFYFTAVFQKLEHVD